MIDTVHFWFESTLINGYDPHVIKDLLPNPSDPIFGKNGSVKYVGWLTDGYWVGITERGIWFSESSLSKYLTGSNFNTMTIQQTKEAIEKLSDDIGLPMEKAKVTRLDVAANVDLSQRPEMYFPFLGNCQYYTRGAFDHSLLWSNKARAKTFYNKIQEATDKKKIIPDQWKNKNVGRFEIRYLNSQSVKYHLKQPVYGKDLYNEAFIIKLPDKMTTEYKTIRKRKEAKEKKLQPRTCGQYFDVFFMRPGIIKKNLDIVLKEIDEYPYFSTEKEKDRAIKKAKSYFEDTRTEYPDLLRELDAKVKEAKESILSEIRL